MELSLFAIWKFRNIEGFLQGFRAFDVETSKYIDPSSLDISWIRYNFREETARIERPEMQTVEVSFSGLVDKLKELGMYAERPDNERHHLAGPQKNDD